MDTATYDQAALATELGTSTVIISMCDYLAWNDIWALQYTDEENSNFIRDRIEEIENEHARATAFAAEMNRHRRYCLQTEATLLRRIRDHFKNDSYVDELAAFADFY